ncbi:hypothetical protein ACFYVL_28200 [Streptomyces sp. NPDC004111]|uniref:hypothetical protein n=1 Tax=Streptomyces sp. NPDC004111 TaxID=3364690 RepID=UPI0036B00345
MASGGNRPETYGGRTAEQLAAALRPHGIRTTQVWGIAEGGQDAKPRGIKRPPRGIKRAEILRSSSCRPLPAHLRILP